MGEGTLSRGVFGLARRLRWAGSEEGGGGAIATVHRRRSSIECRMRPDTQTLPVTRTTSSAALLEDPDRKRHQAGRSHGTGIHPTHSELKIHDHVEFRVRCALEVAKVDPTPERH